MINDGSHFRMTLRRSQSSTKQAVFSSGYRRRFFGLLWLLSPEQCSTILPFIKLNYSPNVNVSADGKKLNHENLMEVEYHNFEKDNFCSVFVLKKDGATEDGGWIVSWVHNEETDVSQVLVIDAQNFEGKPAAKITLPQREPYGFYGTFFLIPN
ncbi:LOW QUALITY PROTEIN: hypothetical protein BT93_C0237 [Corymbia citriodora subsp. variegata]|nr:LOW QUALITY PROTEIN: hypothetical protein BT93_C0237 [Corymbia citriodora subsp. variegata]